MVTQSKQRASRPTLRKRREEWGAVTVSHDPGTRGKSSRNRNDHWLHRSGGRVALQAQHLNWLRGTDAHGYRSRRRLRKKIEKIFGQFVLAGKRQTGGLQHLIAGRK